MPDLEAASHLFSATPMFVSNGNYENMLAQVQTLEAVIANPQFAQHVRENSPAIASVASKTHGVLMGYDFHVDERGPRLIEINTNAGGALLVDALYRAQDVCCWNGDPVNNAELDNDIVEMFQNEWSAAGRAGTPKTIAIVDEQIEDQFLYPEFLMFAQILQAAGITPILSSPEDLSFRYNKLWHDDTLIDLVYNRSVDFYFEQENHSALKQAFTQDSAVITPSPAHHALYAAKQNLTILSDARALEQLGAPPEQIAGLELLPKTVSVTSLNADELWGQRKALFFKPVSGHGGKAVYRGDKLTKKVWSQILLSNYVAQELARPEMRNAKSENIDIDIDRNALKSDVRLYTYSGRVLLGAARLYQGQTTNFRTEGGGFAPLYVI
ncbi:hypothetical protein [Maritalea sp.]|uniref:hypothetical protein n=1 Tax=Maritalea sp. TaxID=2003361 RepID=UPI003EF4BD63